MEIVQILPTIFRFKDCKCSECYYRFGCWTSQSNYCPLKAVRVIEEDIGDNHLFMRFKGAKVSINNDLGKFDNCLLEKISKDLLEEWYESQQKS